MQDKLESIKSNLYQFNDDMERFYNACGEAVVIGRGYITKLDLESALRNCGMFEFKRKRELKAAIAGVQRIVDDYKSKAE